MVNQKCRLYDDEHCAENCNDDWPKCAICDKYLAANDVDFEEINAYTVYSTTTSCCDQEDWDREMYICPECFKKLKCKHDWKYLAEANCVRYYSCTKCDKRREVGPMERLNWEENHACKCKKNLL